MTLLEWRKSPERRSLALDMLNQQTMREMVAVMDAEHPGRQAHRVQDGFGATKALGFIEGYQEAMNVLRSFTEPVPAQPESLPVTWNAETQQS